MSTDKKPEWFEIVESDQPIQRRVRERKISARPVVALAVSGLILGAGALIANVGEDSPAAAETSVSSSPVTTSASSDSSSPAVTSQSQAPAEATSTQIATPASPSTGIQNPMTNGGRGDDDGELDQRHVRDGRHGDREFRGDRHSDGDHEGFEGDDD